MEEKKKVLKKAIVASIGAVAAILTLLLLYGLATGRVQETIVKYEALNYMENKYKEKFEMKKYGKYDKIFKTSWGYELWMVPKNKPDKDYTDDMEVYVFKKNGKFYDNNYEESKLMYLSWQSYRTIINEYFNDCDIRYFIVVVNQMNNFVNIDNFKEEKDGKIRIILNLYIYDNKKVIEKTLKKIVTFINFNQLNKSIDEMNIDIFISEDKWNTENIRNNYRIYERSRYIIRLEKKNYKKIKKISDLKKYLIKN